MKKPLLILTGPTAVGKTGLSIALAEKLNGEIVSADSMQVYQFMNIGTAKIKEDEMKGIQHHLIDIIDPKENFSIETFVEKANIAIDDIHSRGKLPILVGGTAFYIQGLLKGLSFDGVNPKIRANLEDRLKAEGIDTLYEELIQKDPVLISRIHPNNHRRVLRALEYILTTGKTFSSYNETQRQLPSLYNSAYIILDLPREVLYERINQRVDEMIKEGLVEEVKSLLSLGLTKEHQSMKGLDYKQVIDYLEGRYNFEEMVETIKKETRHFAKRQLTWYKREDNTFWIHKNEYKTEEDIICRIFDICREVGINVPKS